MQRAHDFSSRGLEVFFHGGTALHAVQLNAERQAAISLGVSLGKLSGGFRRQGLFNCRDNDTERCRIVHCHLSQLLPIDFNFGQ